MDVDENSENSSTDGQNRPRMVQKRERNRTEMDSLEKAEREARIEVLQKEMDSLFKYYDEVKSQKVDIDLDQCSSSISIVFALTEESELPLSMLLDEIYEKMKNIHDGDFVKVSIRTFGRRVNYGLPNGDKDVMEDISKECLWCWEIPDLTLMPKYIRGILSNRRTCRRKIHERITALLAMQLALRRLETDQTGIRELTKASEELVKVFDEANIRLLMDGLSQKITTEMTEKEVEREEKLMVKQIKRNQREAEKEKQRTEKEQKKERLQRERELKVKEREEKRQKKKEIDAEKEQRRKEKEEAEHKHHISLLNQASFMSRFLRGNSSSPSPK